MSKQDRQGVRTPADVERKYNLGQLAAARGESQKQELALSQLTQTVNQYMASNNGNIENLNKELDKLNEDTNGSLEELNSTINDLNEEIEKLNKIIEELPDNPGGGESGTSPTIDVADIDGGHRVTITDAEGTESFDVMDGKNGADGYTPVKDKDYFDGKDGAKGDKGDPFTYEDFTPEQLEALNPKPTIYTASKNVQITTAGIDTPISGASVTVPKGIYIITAYAVFQTGTSSGARNNHIRVMAGSTAIANQRIFAGAANYGAMTISAIYEATGDVTLTVRKSSSITENSAGETTITAVRIA